MRRNDDQGNAQLDVTCAVYREALSAQFDGEKAPVETAVHLAACPSCAEWARIVPDIQRPLRMQSADAVPDLAERILTAILGDVPRPSLGMSLARAALMAAALVQVFVGVLHLFAHDDSAGHTAAELGAWSVAIGIGFATAALRPNIAYAVLPMVSGLVAILGYASVRDLLASEVSVARVLEHALIAAGLVLLASLAWMMRRRRVMPSPRSALQPVAVRGLLPR
ncbi:hypothetical protein [Cumulibacter soli]|uniref:hypothetical protein n=1 Tax=Cumulibacter soli TaxID=2546344 RepID=UPI001068C627|nr:hypothetical protein [Cumulibacter soli]